MDHSHMDHGGHMGHDMPGMGGDGPKCNMNVRLHPSLLVSILKRTYADFRWCDRCCLRGTRPTSALSSPRGISRAPAHSSFRYSP